MAALLEDLDAQTDRFIATLYRGFEEERTIFLCGNGGSAAAASHFGQDLAKGTLSSMSATRRFRVIPLTDNIGFITALANDEGYESIFEQQLRNLAREGDLLVAISGSGNSPNVLRAVEYAHSIGMTTIGVTGFDGGKLRALARARACTSRSTTWGCARRSTASCSTRRCASCASGLPSRSSCR